MNLTAGVTGGMSIIPIANRYDLYNLLNKLNNFIEIKNVKDGELISDRLFKKYVGFEEAKKNK